MLQDLNLEVNIYKHLLGLFEPFRISVSDIGKRALFVRVSKFVFLQQYNGGEIYNLINLYFLKKSVLFVSRRSRFIYSRKLNGGDGSFTVIRWIHLVTRSVQPK